MGSLLSGDRALPKAMPTKNIATSITAITPSFRGGESLRICLSKSSWSRRSIFTSPFLFKGNAEKLLSVSPFAVEQTLGSLIEG